MVVKPWFSHEVGKDFRKGKRENGGEEYYLGVGEGAIFVGQNIVWKQYERFVIIQIYQPK
jgi:hypothetical protein